MPGLLHAMCPGTYATAAAGTIKADHAHAMCQRARTARMARTAAPAQRTPWQWKLRATSASSTSHVPPAPTLLRRRDRKRGTNVHGLHGWHVPQHRSAVTTVLNVNSFTAAQNACKNAKKLCDDDTSCTAAETRQKKKRNKAKRTFMCERHVANINFASQRTKSCKKALCSIKSGSAD